MKHRQAVPENTRFVFLAAYPVWFLLWVCFFFNAIPHVVYFECDLVWVCNGDLLADSGIQTDICTCKQLDYTHNHSECFLHAILSHRVLRDPDSLQSAVILEKCQLPVDLHSLLQLIGFITPCCLHCFSSYERTKADK